MARENYVLLYGRVLKEPVLTVNEQGNYKLGSIVLQTARKSYATDSPFLGGTIRWDTPCIRSKREGLIRDVFSKIQVGDMLLVKGNLCSKEVVRAATCPYCGDKVRKPGGVMTYIDPISVYIETLGEGSFETYAEIRKLSEKDKALLKKTGLIGISQQEANDLMERKVEISNQIYLDGELCREPTIYEDATSNRVQTQFQIAVNRKRYIPEDSPDKRTDYIWIKAYGQLARECQNVLHLHSKVTINGAIQTKEINSLFFCDRCGGEFLKTHLSQEVVPYSIEYRENCNLPEAEERDEEEY